MNIFIANIVGAVAELRPEESWHCAKVLRFKTGQTVNIIDGQGHFYEAVLDLVNEKKCIAKIISGPREQKPSNYQLHLGIAPTKSIDRIEWMLEKAVEIGVTEITLFTSKNSERTVVKEDRLRGIIESATKQSLQARIPKLNSLPTLEVLLKNVQADQKMIAHCFDKEKIDIKKVEFKNKSTCVLIGPEGDFTESELKAAIGSGFVGLSLGENRLRTETAGLFVCQAASILS